MMSLLNSALEIAGINANMLIVLLPIYFTIVKDSLIEIVLFYFLITWSILYFVIFVWYCHCFLNELVGICQWFINSIWCVFGAHISSEKYSLNIWSNCLLLQQERRPHDARLPVPVRQKNVHSVNTVAKTRGCAWEIDLSHKFLPSSPLVQMKGHGFEIGLGWRWMGQQYLRWKVIRISSSLGGFSGNLFGILIYSPCPSQDSLQVSANLQQAWLREIAFGNKGFCNEPNFWLKLLSSLCILFLHSQN